MLDSIPLFCARVKRQVMIVAEVEADVAAAAQRINRC